jgi:hypothetical protein
MKGFVIIRGGIVDHLLAGNISLFDLGVYLVIQLQADFRTGVWRGSAPRLLATASRGTNLRQVQRALQNLTNQGLLRSFHVRGKRGNFCVLLDRYEIKMGALRGKRLIASKSEDWRNPYYETCADGIADDDADGVAEGAPSSGVINHKSKSSTKRVSPGSTSSSLSHPFVHVWNLLRGPLAEVKKLSLGRLAKCRAREREMTVNEFGEIVKLAAATPFCTGVNDRRWKVDFDWLIENDTNLLKVKEGRYSQGGKPNATQHDHATTDAAAASIRARFN